MKIILEKSNILNKYNTITHTGNKKIGDSIRDIDKNTSIGYSSNEIGAMKRTQLNKATKEPLQESAAAGLGIVATGATLYGGKKALDNVFEKADEHKSALENAIKTLSDGE